VTSEQVEDHLLVECAKWNGRTDLLIAAPTDFDPSAHFELQLEALVAVGVLEDAKAALWRRRFAEAAEPQRPVAVDAALRARIDAYLESLLPEEDGSDAFDEALDVLQDLGLLAEEDIDRWFERVAGAEGWDGDAEGDDDWIEFVGRELRSVALGPGEEVDGFRLVALELYDDGVIARWSAAEHELATEIELSDDVDTDYQPVGGSSGGGGPSRRVRGVTNFVPAVPTGASRLVLTRDGDRVELDLRR
jgi:hypothetical protein